MSARDDLNAQARALVLAALKLCAFADRHDAYITVQQGGGPLGPWGPWDRRPESDAIDAEREAAHEEMHDLIGNLYCSVQAFDDASRKLAVALAEVQP